MPSSILFLTHAEHGQANIILSTAGTIAQKPGYRIHIASYKELHGRVVSLSEQTAGSSSIIAFHTLPGKSMKGTINQLYPEGANVMVSKPGLRNAVRCVRIWMTISRGAGPKEYLEDHLAIQDLIRQIEPAAIVIDALFLLAHDAARGLGLRYITMDPISAQMSVGFVACKSFLQYPMAGLGSQFPLTWYNKIRNYLFIIAVVVVPWFVGGTAASIREAQRSIGIEHSMTAMLSYRSDDLYLCPHVAETNFPGEMKLPANIIGIPPLAPETLSTDRRDHALWQWLKKGPTVLINFGTSDTVSDVRDTAAIAEGLKFLMGTLPDTQILWKIRFEWEQDPGLRHLKDSLVGTGRLRVTEWLIEDPSTLLNSGHIVCSVHHGGANSFYEACRAGVPHLILPMWVDTFVFAERARYLGFGLIGNAGTAPRVDASQFKAKLLRVMTDAGIRGKAADIGRICREMGDGKEIAANAIVEWVRGQHEDEVKS